MGFYGTLKLIFFKVSIDDRIDQLTPVAVVRLVRDDEAFLRATGNPLQISCDRLIDDRSAPHHFDSRHENERIPT